MARDNLYSTVVVWVKVILPTVALALLSTLFLVASNPNPEDALPYAEVDVAQVAREQRVSQPRFAGVLSEGRELILVADAVAISGDQTDRIRGQAIEGRMDLTETEVLTLTSAIGDFDMAAQMATLSDGVHVSSSDGYQMESEQMFLALDSVGLRTPTPVHITGPGLDLTADTMEMSGDEGATILRFNGSVRLLYTPQTE